uniref:Uncharacterized protein n=1 Tax=Siphoviridae sp. ctt0c4 TaxID=2825702 RepID=A0A8S5V3D0_9CAUD|nr:MAG TPA: hypothetical protein [Siphoviridae sp. ctt0c4]
MIKSHFSIIYVNTGCAIIYNYNIPVFKYLIIPIFIYASMQIPINQ